MPQLWRFLVLDDASVNAFMIRDADSRSTDRERVIINEWLKSTKPFHCMRDNIHHQVSFMPIFAGMWGGRRKALKKLLKYQMKNLVNGFSLASANNKQWHSLAARKTDQIFLTEKVWKVVLHTKSGMCHDSHWCRRLWQQNSRRMPNITDGEFMGRQYEAYGKDRDKLVLVDQGSVDKACYK
jgi:hypothetical protein